MIRSTFDEPGDLALNDDETDIVFDEGIEALAQQIALGLICLVGTWSWDLNEGFPLLQLVFSSATSLGLAYSSLKEYFESFPDVISILDLQLNPERIDGRNVVNVQFSLDTEFGVLHSKDIYLPDIQI